MKTAEEILKSKLDGKITFVNNPDYTFNKVIEAMEEYRLQSHPSPMSAADMTAREYFDGEGSPLTLSKICNDEEKEFLLQHIELYASGKVHQSKQPPMSAEQYDLQKLYDWIMDENRKPSITAFTSSIARNIASEFEFRLSKHKSAMSAEQVGLGYYYPLFKFFADEHGLTLLDSQMQDVIHECKKFIEPATTGENWKTEYDNCRALLQELVSLKVMRENLYKGNPDGKEYAERKPKAWQAAQQFLSTYQHEGLSTTPSVKADGWVSVEDGLPEIPPPYYDKDNEVHKPIQVEVWCFDGSEVYEDWFYFNSKPVGCTHWKYKEAIPSPPKQK